MYSVALPRWEKSLKKNSLVCCDCKVAKFGIWKANNLRQEKDPRIGNAKRK
jgi:hypothetical protein